MASETGLISASRMQPTRLNRVGSFYFKVGFWELVKLGVDFVRTKWYNVIITDQDTMKGKTMTNWETKVSSKGMKKARKSNAYIDVRIRQTDEGFLAIKNLRGVGTFMASDRNHFRQQQSQES